ncbi:hypothetical protein [Actinoallomurus rhizosphaericola]|uniref:hypothetical protein n=1 Tax=Actinoallomurus rhizosphaericola TaxID=2952536 RepID=UPI0020933127|nr:hypothetical protein [Actinoallomurus rhizosphaericola]MCO5998183.1 hypothetical protein [Actinoallomurus rhizosphaericola]
MDEVRLVPVVEAYTGVLDDVDLGPINEARWDAYCRERIVAAGLPAPVAAHPWLVPAAGLRGAGLARLVRAASFTDGPDDDVLLDRLRDPATRQDTLEEVPVLSGGYVLETREGRCLALPGCCGDLGNLDEWRTAVRHDAAAPATLWIGHPWLLVGGDGPVLTLSGPTEDGAAPAPVVAQVSRDALAAAVVTAERDVAGFAERLRAVCADLVGTDVAPLMAGALLG